MWDDVDALAKKGDRFWQGLQGDVIVAIYIELQIAELLLNTYNSTILYSHMYSRKLLHCHILCSDQSASSIGSKAVPTD